MHKKRNSDENFNSSDSNIMNKRGIFSCGFFFRHPHLIRRFLWSSTSIYIILFFIFTLILYINIRHVFTFDSTANVTTLTVNSQIKETKIIQEKKGLSIYDQNIIYNDFNYLNSDTLTYENRTYSNNIKILYRLPKKVSITALLLIFHGCSRSQHDWFHTIERQRIIGAAIDLGYGCLAFQATDYVRRCWSSDTDTNRNEDIQMVFKGLDGFYKDYPKLESLPRFTFGASSGGIFSSIFVTNQRYKIQGQILFISFIHPYILETKIKSNTYPSTAWIYMLRDVDFASEERINASIKTFIEQKIPYISYDIKPICVTSTTFHDRIPTITKNTSYYIFNTLQKHRWLDSQNYLMYNPRRTSTWETFLFKLSNKTQENKDILNNLQENKHIFPDFLNTIYGEHEISFERSHEALKWHKHTFDNKVHSATM